MERNKWESSHRTILHSAAFMQKKLGSMGMRHINLCTRCINMTVVSGGVYGWASLSLFETL